MLDITNLLLGRKPGRKNMTKRGCHERKQLAKDFEGPHQGSNVPEL